MSDTEDISLVPIATALSGKEEKLAKNERTKIGSNRAAYAIGGMQRLHVSDLANRKNIAGVVDATLKKQTNKVLRKNNVFNTPLEKKELKKASRKMYYDQTVKAVDKWDNTVKKFRTDSSIDLRDPNQRIQMVPTEAKTRKLGSELERELDAILHGSKYIPEEGEELSRAEKMILSSVSVEEAKMRRMELQKHRHLQSQYQSKARRMRKIKSKNFHRHLKKRDKKEQEKASQEDGDDLEEKQIKERAVDRATLSHSSTGSKWSKKVKRLAWKDDELQKQINNQNAEREKRRQRTEKGEIESESEDENGNEEKEEEKKIDAKNIVNELGDNQWFDVANAETEILANIESAIENVGKTVTENSGIMNLPSITSANQEPDANCEVPINEIEKALNEVTKDRKRRRVENASDDDESDSKKISEPRTIESMTEKIAEKQKSPIKPPKKVKKSTEPIIDVTKVLTKSTAKIVETEDADGTTTTIREAFADDDIIREFKSDKRAKIEEEKGKVVDLILPGWDGKWAGEDFKPSKRQKKRFRIKQKVAPRQDQNLGHVIISEQNKALEKMQVERLPFPFQNAKQFEKSISQPIGNTWNTAGGLREMIKPEVQTTPGQIIAPAGMEKEKRFSDIFTVNDEPEKEKKKIIPKRIKRGRRKTAADDLTLSAM